MKKLLLKLTASAIIATSFVGCSDNHSSEKTSSGITNTTALSRLDVKTNADGLTLEQANIVRSYEVENRPGAVKHLYVISPTTGKCLIYSTVDGKVTSNTKSLIPSKVHADSRSNGLYIKIRGNTEEVTDIMNESGTYGTSVPNYIYWWDVQGRYHKLFITGGSLVTISDQPMPIREIVLDMTVTIKTEEK